MYTEDRLQLVVNNHLYMEHALQSTYTAGVFFLFQKAVVKEVVVMAPTLTAVSLRFDRNIEETIVWLSIPTESALLTLAGCALLVAGVVVVVLWPRFAASKSGGLDPFADITTAHVVAHVMLDEETFPPLLVQRRVVHATGVENETCSPKEEDVDKFVIGAVALQPQPQSDSRPRATSLA